MIVKYYFYDMKKFSHKGAEAVEKWMESEDGKPYARDFKIVFLAYKQTYKPPVKYVSKTNTKPFSLMNTRLVSLTIWVRVIV